MMRIRPALRLAALLFIGLHAPEANAMSPLPFFQRVERVGLLCAVDVAGGVPAADLGEGELCGRAAAVLSGLTASRPAVMALAPNDARIAAPATLLLLIHATLRAEDGQRLLALAATLQRAGSDASPPFFVTPPQALHIAGSLDEASLDAALGRLLDPLARALRANP
ncbi:hypothetical protein [Azospirillum thiophilum]|nr:hypothetical protein [Azospirillum thiophilum]